MNKKIEILLAKTFLGKQQQNVKHKPTRRENELLDC